MLCDQHSMGLLGTTSLRLFRLGGGAKTIGVATLQTDAWRLHVRVVVARVAPTSTLRTQHSRCNVISCCTGSHGLVLTQEASAPVGLAGHPRACGSRNKRKYVAAHATSLNDKVCGETGASDLRSAGFCSRTISRGSGTSSARTLRPARSPMALRRLPHRACEQHTCASHGPHMALLDVACVANGLCIDTHVRGRGP